MTDWFFPNVAGRDFVLFNDEELTMEPVSGEDLEPIEINSGSRFASEAWSCNCTWYFIVLPDGLALLNVYTNRGFLCKKRSAKFIEMFLDAPTRKKGRHK